MTAFRAMIMRHAVVAAIAASLVAIFWWSRPDMDGYIRLWRSAGDSAFILLVAALCIGPLARLWRGAIPLVGWRREVGIWFAVLATLHYLLIRDAADGISPPLPTLLGYTALVITLIIAATSSNFMTRILGGGAWKWIQSHAHVVFYLVALHAAYFLFLGYPNDHWFRFVYLVLVILVPVLQLTALAKSVIQAHRARSSKRIDDARASATIVAGDE